MKAALRPADRRPRRLARAWAADTTKHWDPRGKPCAGATRRPREKVGANPGCGLALTKPAKPSPRRTATLVAQETTHTSNRHWDRAVGGANAMSQEDHRALFPFGWPSLPPIAEQKVQGFLRRLHGFAPRWWAFTARGLAPESRRHGRHFEARPLTSTMRMQRKSQPESFPAQSLLAEFPRSPRGSWRAPGTSVAAAATDPLTFSPR